MSDRALRFVKAITILARTFRTEPDEILLEAYTMGLEDISIEDIETAVRRCVKGSKFMPSPVELRESVCGVDIQKLYRRAGKKCPVCDLELCFPESFRRGYCAKCWRGILEANGLTQADEDVFLAARQIGSDKPPALPRSRGGVQITGSDFDA